MSVVNSTFASSGRFAKGDEGQVPGAIFHYEMSFAWQLAS